MGSTTRACLPLPNQFSPIFELVRAFKSITERTAFGFGYWTRGRFKSYPSQVIYISIRASELLSQAQILPSVIFGLEPS